VGKSLLESLGDLYSMNAEATGCFFVTAFPKLIKGSGEKNRIFNKVTKGRFVLFASKAAW